jgi:hypothetical protein
MVEGSQKVTPNRLVSVQEEHRLKILVEEYKEMRNEIRAAYGQYFSVVFGVILTGILITFYMAFENEPLFLAIPLMISGWICVIILIRLNIQNIAKYIRRLESNINAIVGTNSLDYETNHAKALWFSRKVKLVGSIPVAVVIGIYLISIYRGYWYLTESSLTLFGACLNRLAWPYTLVAASLLFIIVPVFVIFPERIFRSK